MGSNTGPEDGVFDDVNVGTLDGTNVGLFDGTQLGFSDGSIEGTIVRATVGYKLGVTDGFEFGKWLKLIGEPVMIGVGADAVGIGLGDREGPEEWIGA